MGKSIGVPSMVVQIPELTRKPQMTTEPMCCRLCGKNLRHRFVDLGMHPPCESFLTPDQLDRMEPFFPLYAMVCDNCYLVQLKEYFSPEQIFSEYAYFSSFAESWVEHARNYVDMIAERLHLRSDSLVIELASNDGYLLQHFLPKNIPVLGIEPAANVAESALAKGVRTHVDFFGTKLAYELGAKGYLADLIIGNNVLAQVPDLNDFVRGMQLLLKPEGTITLEFPHVLNLIEQNQFDTIYHEHFSYFSLLTIRILAERHSLKVIDVDEIPTHGGSLRVYLAHLSDPRKPHSRVSALIKKEKAFGLADMATYEQFGEKVRRTKRDLLSFLIAAKNTGKVICGYGAPGKGNTLLNFCGIGTDFLDFTVDRNPYKHGRYTPGMHIPIYDVAAIEARKPDYVLVLPWNFKTEIMQQMQHIKDWGAKFIIPIPHVMVIDPALLAGELK